MEGPRQLIAGSHRPLHSQTFQRSASGTRGLNVIRNQGRLRQKLLRLCGILFLLRESSFGRSRKPTVVGIHTPRSRLQLTPPSSCRDNRITDAASTRERALRLTCRFPLLFPPLGAAVGRPGASDPCSSCSASDPIATRGQRHRPCAAPSPMQQCSPKGRPGMRGAMMTARHQVRLRLVGSTGKRSSGASS